IPDVEGEPAAGQTIIWDDEDETWVPGASGGTIARIGMAGDSSNNAFDVSHISLRNGLQFVRSTDGVIFLEVRLGGTGTSTEVARRDHRHRRHSSHPLPISPGGYLSSGTRPLTSTSLVLPEGVEYEVRTTLRMQLRGGDPGPCYYTATITTGGVSKT